MRVRHLPRFPRRGRRGRGEKGQVALDGRGEERRGPPPTVLLISSPNILCGRANTSPTISSNRDRDTGQTRRTER